MKTCAFKGCERENSSRGLCDVHRQQAKKGIALKPILRASDPCPTPGCDRLVRARGICFRCYQRLRWQGNLPARPDRSPAPNPDLPGTMLVPLTGGRFAIIDRTDAEPVGRYRWSSGDGGQSRTWYAYRKHVGRYLSLHRFLWDLWGMPNTPEIDHENGNGLDCRRSNLRPATHVQNMHNMRTPASNTSGVKGVSWDSSRGLWAAAVRCLSTRRRARFQTLEEAAGFVASARAELHGQFARTE